MREIKFRGRADSGPNKGKWYYGFYWTNGMGNHFIRVTKDENGFCIYDIEVDPETVGQYTGTHDSKRNKEYPEGQEIYEGDNVTYPDANILHHDTFIGVGTVEYDEESMCFYFTDRETVGMDEICIKIEVEVIGNIHDNPELMKESD